MTSDTAETHQRDYAARHRSHDFGAVSGCELCGGPHRTPDCPKQKGFTPLYASSSNDAEPTEAELEAFGIPGMMH